MDAFKYGTGFMQGGKRVDPKDVYLQDPQAERVRELEADAARYQWLKRNVGEALTENSMKNEFSEHKMRYVFPTLISWADFCGPITLDEAIDFKIEQALSATAREEQSCKS
jgi:hypothetical protein